MTEEQAVARAREVVLEAVRRTGDIYGANATTEDRLALMLSAIASALIDVGRKAVEAQATDDLSAGRGE